MSRRAYGLAAATCGVLAAQLSWAITSHHPALRVPAAIAWVAVWVLVVAAVRLVALSVAPESEGDGFAALLTGGLAAIGSWVAFGPGARMCTSGDASGVANVFEGSTCRVPFGIGAVATVAIAVVAGRRWYVRTAAALGTPSARPDAYVYVEEDGTTRELTPAEREYLAEGFLPGDGARPAIKGSYRQRTPDGMLRGFLHRRLVPPHVTVHE